MGSFVDHTSAADNDNDDDNDDNDDNTDVDAQWYIPFHWSLFPLRDAGFDGDVMDVDVVDLYYRY